MLNIQNELASLEKGLCNIKHFLEGKKFKRAIPLRKNISQRNDGYCSSLEKKLNERSENILAKIPSARNTTFDIDVHIHTVQELEESISEYIDEMKQVEIISASYPEEVENYQKSILWYRRNIE